MAMEGVDEKLYDGLIDTYSLGELKELCRALKVEPEDLNYDTRPELAHALISYMRRRGHLGDLIGRLQKERPHTTWPDPPPDDEENLPLIDAETNESPALKDEEATTRVQEEPVSLSDREQAVPQTGIQAEARRRLTARVVFVAAFLILIVLGLTWWLIFRPLPYEFVQIPAGQFLMGSSEAEVEFAKNINVAYDTAHEQPQHPAYLDDYAIGKYEVTVEQYNRCVRAGVCDKAGDQDYSTDDPAKLPVTLVDWEDARTFCEWIGGRLPTEAEWEKAAQGPNSEDEPGTNIYPWGNEWDSNKAHVRVEDRKDNDGEPLPIGTYRPDGDSFYEVSDVSGNVWEWVSDWYDEDYYRQSPGKNPPGPATGDYRVVRGGSFANSKLDARTTARAYFGSEDASRDVGFRCAKE